MATIPQTPTIEMIYRHYEARPRGVREYLGASEIGEPCERMLWYRFRHVMPIKFPGRILRLFETGSREEDRLIGNLMLATGAHVCGQQWKVSCCGGHCRGHLDGVVTGLLESPATPHLLEIKTSNKKTFDALEKNGVEKTKPVHFAQMQLYGYLADLERWAYLVQCKDDDRLYLERGEVKRTIGKSLVAKAQKIISAESPPDRIGKDPSFYICRFCSFTDYCHGTNVFPAVNCRTCVQSTPAADGTWRCEIDSTIDQGCHLFIPGLLHWTEPVNGGDGWIEYEAGFVNCAATSFPKTATEAYSSEQLAAISG
jgi:hypothetical protein